MNAPDGYLSLAALVAAKTTLLLLVAFAVSFLLRKTSASARHVLWALTFVFLLFIPGMAYVSWVQQEVSIPIAVLAPDPEVAPVISAPGATQASRESRERGASLNRPGTPRRLDLDTVLVSSRRRTGRREPSCSSRWRSG
jgi:hypothetical protein